MTEEQAMMVEEYEAQGLAYKAACLLVGVEPVAPVTPVLQDDVALSEEELQAVCRAKVPALLARLMDDALVSDDEKFALRVLDKILLERGYGKATQQIQITNPNRDVRAGWSAVDVIEAEVIEETDVEETDTQAD